MDDVTVLLLGHMTLVAMVTICLTRRRSAPLTSEMVREVMSITPRRRCDRSLAIGHRRHLVWCGGNTREQRHLVLLVLWNRVVRPLLLGITQLGIVGLGRVQTLRHILQTILRTVL